MSSSAIRVPGFLWRVWRLFSSMDQRLRYEEPIKWLNDADGPLLEVGSGTHGITRYLRRPTIGLDVQFGRFDLGYLTPVRGSVLQLPFANDQFNHVLSVDMLEHLPAQLRPQAIQELVRVARKRLVIVVPCEGGQAADRRLARCLSPFGIPSWLEEHLAHGLPAKSQISQLLEEALKAKEIPYRIQQSDGVSANWWFWLSLTGHWLPLRLLLHTLLLPFAPLIARWSRKKPAYRVAYLVEWKTE